MSTDTPKPSKAQRFVEQMLQRCQQDKGLAAALRRADNPATEYQSWEYLAAFEIDLTKDWQRLPYVTVAAALARAKAEKNGRLGLGGAVASCYEDGCENDQAKAKLRRLLACDSLSELCRVLRPLLSLFDSKGKGQLDYSCLLEQLQNFERQGQRIKAQWAQEFYGRVAIGGDA